MQQNATAAIIENQIPGYCKHGGNMLLLKSGTHIPNYKRP